jgi:hypothetical protein
MNIGILDDAYDPHEQDENVIEIVDPRADKLVDIGKEITEIVWEFDVSYTEACIMYCDKYYIEYEQFGSTIKAHQRIMYEIQLEAEDARCLKPGTSYKIDFE